MFPADTTSGAGSASGSAPSAATATPAAAGSAISPAAASPTDKPFSTPADDWQARYNDLESKHNGWKEFGDDPAKVREALAWARERAAEIQAGKLTYAQQQEQRRQEQTDRKSVV